MELGQLKTICVLNRTFLTYQRTEPRYAPAREECRLAALHILDIFVEYTAESRPGGRLEGDAHGLSSLTLHDCLLAATVLCLDLMESVDLR